MDGRLRNSVRVLGSERSLVQWMPSKEQNECCKNRLVRREELVERSLYAPCYIDCFDKKTSLYVFVLMIRKLLRLVYGMISAI